MEQKEKKLWSDFYAPTSADSEQHAREAIPKSLVDPVAYLNELFHDVAIKEYKTEARKTLLAAAGKHGRILDLGCGSGAELKLLASEAVQHGEFPQLIGVDPSEEFVEASKKACQEHSNVQILKGGGEKLSSVVSSKVDAVRIERVLQHIDLEIIKKILKEVESILNPGGILLVTEPLWTDRHVDLGLENDEENARVHDTVLANVFQTLKNPNIGRQLVKLCADAGLEVIDVKVHTSVARTFAEFDRVTPAHFYGPRFQELLLEAEKKGTLCVLFPFVTVKAKKKN